MRIYVILFYYSFILLVQVTWKITIVRENHLDTVEYCLLQ